MFYLWLWIMMFVLVCCVGAGGTYLQSRFRRRCLDRARNGEAIEEEPAISPNDAPISFGPFTPPPYSAIPPRPPGYTAIVGSKEYGPEDSIDKPPSYHSREIYNVPDSSLEATTSQ